MSFQFDGEYSGSARPQSGSRRRRSWPEEPEYREPAFAGDTYVPNHDGFPVPPQPAAYQEPAPPARPASRPRPRSGERGRGGPPPRPARGEPAPRSEPAPRGEPSRGEPSRGEPSRGEPSRSEPARRSRSEPARRPATLTSRRLAGLLVAAIGLVVIALLVPSIVRSLRTDTIDGTVVAASGARPAGRWQVSLLIPEQSQAVVFGARSAEEARVGLPVTISVPAAKISRVSGFIAQLTPRTASEGGGFAAVVQNRGTTRVVPSPGMTADVQLGS